MFTSPLKKKKKIIQEKLKIHIQCSQKVLNTDNLRGDGDGEFFLLGDFLGERLALRLFLRLLQTEQNNLSFAHTQDIRSS